MRCPYGCTPFEFGFQDCVSFPGRLPKEGDVGMCYVCGGWWTISGRQCVKYVPTPEESNLAYSNLEESKKRAEEAARLEGKRLI